MIAWTWTHLEWRVTFPRRGAGSLVRTNVFGVTYERGGPAFVSPRTLHMPGNHGPRGAGISRETRERLMSAEDPFNPLSFLAPISPDLGRLLREFLEDGSSGLAVRKE